MIFTECIKFTYLLAQPLVAKKTNMYITGSISECKYCDCRAHYDVEKQMHTKILIDGSIGVGNCNLKDNWDLAFFVHFQTFRLDNASLQAFSFYFSVSHTILLNSWRQLVLGPQRDFVWLDF